MQIAREGPTTGQQNVIELMRGRGGGGNEEGFIIDEAKKKLP